MDDLTLIQQNLQSIHTRIEAACVRANRQTNEVRLLMATKTVDVDRIKLAVGLGEKLIGENKVQEYVEKWEGTKDLNIERHFIGHLQTNKVKDIIKYVTCIESVDRIELVEKLDQRLQYENKSIDIYLEVNTSGEDSKSGTEPSNAIALLKKISEYDTINVKGLMTIGLPSDNPEDIRPCFKTLVDIRDRGQDAGLLPNFCELSMGMSHDLETAIEEGSTIVRVGSAIFGKRDYGNI
ncbi:MAG: YggS family pyridoxal phosphate-dependent enzyme [Pseudopedobacter saltans]|uniref:Pyridoxal phosphate homeostasis protein n=1 Tax=Pseudopedobacter saltans TaxID=151895 RepID=A0A2W5GQN3_9SPHI|nr:MAG: YggS family pyridoxal phosphate-dependent enzyme [Pseudopedobacter saltans]